MTNLFSQTIDPFHYCPQYQRYLRKSYSTRLINIFIYAALELNDRVINKMDNDKISFSIILDLSKSFRYP